MDHQAGREKAGAWCGFGVGGESLGNHDGEFSVQSAQGQWYRHIISKRECVFLRGKDCASKVIV